MISDWSGLKNQRHFLLIQKPDPLKYCNYALPFPMPIGLPFMPCDLPNQYELISTDSSYERSRQEDVLLVFQQSVSFIHRFFMPASHRPFVMVGKDYYHHTPYKAYRGLNRCFSVRDRPQLQVYYQEKYIGRIVERTIFNCCCFIYDNREELIYKVVCKSGQRGQFLILPCWGFQKIIYYIIQCQKNSGKDPKSKQQIQQSEIQISGLNNPLKDTKNYQQIQDEEDNDDDYGQIVGQIVHIFNGLSQYTSKNDKYGLTLPEKSTQQQKCLLIYCGLFIDYLLFQNF